MGRGYEKEIYSINRENNKARYVSEYWEMGDLMPNPYPPPIPPKNIKKLEEYLFAGKVFRKDRETSVAAIREFADGAISPREAAFARHRNFHAQQSGHRLFWTEYDRNIDERFNAFRIIPSRYIKRNRGGEFWLDKEWTKNGRLSRILSEGPARVPVPLSSGTPSEDSDHPPRYEWWFSGQLLGFYENGHYVDARSGQSLQRPAPDDDTPWPLENPFYNFLSHSGSQVTADIMACLWEKEQKGEKVLLDPLINEIMRDYPEHSEKEILESMRNLLSYPLLKKGGVLSNKERIRINKRVTKKPLRHINYDAQNRIRHESMHLGTYGADDLMIASFEAFWKDPSKKGLQKILNNIKSGL